MLTSWSPSVPWSPEFRFDVGESLGIAQPILRFFLVLYVLGISKANQAGENIDSFRERTLVDKGKHK